MEDADYRRIRFEDVLTAKDETFRELLKMIAKRRLEQTPDFKNRKLVEIDHLLGELPPEEEAKIIVFGNKTNQQEIDAYPLDKYSKENNHITEIRAILKDKYNIISEKALYELINKKPLLEMLNLLLLRRGEKPPLVTSLFKSYINKQKNESFYKYRTLYEKNKLNLLFQLVSLNPPKQKQYAGFNVFCMLSSGIIRNFLELCYQSFNIALFSDRDGVLNGKKLPISAQTGGAKTRAERYMDVIDGIPEYGNEIKSLVRSLGAIFYSWQEDPALSEPEVTYFCVDYNSVSERSRKILDAAVQWSVLQQKKPMKGKSRTEPMSDVYALNHILAPYFGISYRLRGRIPLFSKDEFEMLLGNESDRKQAIAKLSRGQPRQDRTILDYMRTE